MLNSLYNITTIDGFSHTCQAYRNSEIRPLILLSIDDVNSSASIREYFHKSGQKKEESGVIIKSSKEKYDQLLSQILTILCSYSHISYYSKIPLFIFSSEGDSVRNTLEIQFQGQGYKPWEYEIITVSEEILTLDSNLIIHKKNEKETKISPHSFKEYYFEYLKTDYSPSDIFLINSISSDSTLEAIKTIISSIGSEMTKTSNSYYNLLEEYWSCYKKLNHTNCLYKKKTDAYNIQTELLELSAGSKEVTEILQFYHTEYEILPLWYKRFGHLLKFMIGRRKL